MKGLSRVRENSHARFLGEGWTVRSISYPTISGRALEIPVGDLKPNRNGLMGRTFTDVGSVAPLVAEVSNSHGREIWIKLLDNE